MSLLLSQPFPHFSHVSIVVPLGRATQADIKHEPERWNTAQGLFTSHPPVPLGPGGGFGILLPKVAMHHGSELGLAELLLLTSEPIEVDVRFKSTDLEVEDEAGEGLSNGLFHLADLCEQEAELTIAGGHDGAVT